MITLTSENIELLEHILNEGQVTDNVGEYQNIVFGTRVDDTGDFYRIDTDELLSFDIYMTDDKRRILELEAEIAQLKSIQASVCSSENRKTHIRPQDTHLKSDEVLQIEMDMTSGVNNRYIAISYGISEATASIIRNGKHKFSTFGFNMAQKIMTPRKSSEKSSDEQ